MTAARVLLALALGSSLAAAQDFSRTKQDWISFHPPEPVEIHRGSSTSIELGFRIASGLHINSHLPRQEYLKKTELNLDPPTDIVIEKVRYPAGEDQSFPFAPEEKLSVYSGDFSIAVLVRPLKTVLPAKYAIHGVLKYQACDKAVCYPPKQLPLSFEVQILKNPGGEKRRNPAQSPHAHPSG
ncbi:MAG: hypothetical protein JO159_12320 [Acidobacteria bacterium]|nr:hypothetical protein [Acidobacteriota bacterium]MBV9622660.1 hypothetical protein [Acidobacteriota bacterium]